MSSLPSARNLSRRSALLVATCLLLASTASAQAQTIRSDRTMKDLGDAQAVLDKELKDVRPALSARYLDANGVAFGYSLYPPAAKEPGVKYPLYIATGRPGSLVLPASQKKYPCYVVTIGYSAAFPFADCDSRTATAIRVIAGKILAQYPTIDPDRIYMGGYSSGGTMSWRSALNYPDFYAAILPAAIRFPHAVAQAPLLVSHKIGVWMFIGEKDPFFSVQGNHVEIAAAIAAAGGQCRLTQYSQGTHTEFWHTDSLTNPAWNDFTTVREWLFTQHKPHAEWPLIDSDCTAEAAVGQPFRYTLTARNKPTVFGAESLPPGLSLDPKTGLLSGTPTEAGTTYLTLTATNAKGTGLSTLMLTIQGDANAPSAPATFTGTVQSTVSHHRPRLLVGTAGYELKPSEKADPSVAETLAKISKGEATGTYVVKGTKGKINGLDGILVDSFTKEGKE